MHAPPKVSTHGQTSCKDVKINVPRTVAQHIVGFSQLEELLGTSGFFVSARMKLQSKPSKAVRGSDIHYGIN